MGALVLVGTVLLIGLAIGVRKLLTSVDYPKVALEEIDREALFAEGEALLKRSESWPVEMREEAATLSSSLEPYPVRTVRYDVEVDADFEDVVAYVRRLSYCPQKRLETADKIEEMLYDKSTGETSHEWIRRSVHVSPPPGRNRDAVVGYFEKRPDAKTYIVAFRSVDAMDGRPIEPWENSTRFTVHPAIYSVSETRPGHARIIKIEGVDPQGLVSPFLNNYFISVFFFRKYMFEEAKNMRDALTGGGPGDA